MTYVILCYFQVFDFDIIRNIAQYFKSSFEDVKLLTMLWLRRNPHTFILFIGPH